MGQKTSWFLVSLLIILILALVGIGSYLLGKQNTPKPTPTIAGTSIVTPTPIPYELPTTSGFPSASPKSTSLPKKTATPSPTGTPVPTPLVFQVTSLSASVNPENDVACSPSTKTFTFKGVITVNTAGDVSYKWERSDGANAPLQTIAFLSAGTQEVLTTWTISRNSGQTYNGWERVKIISPNSTASNQASFSVSCP